MSTEIKYRDDFKEPLELLKQVMDSDKEFSKETIHRVENVFSELKEYCCYYLEIKDKENIEDLVKSVEKITVDSFRIYLNTV